jgi:hypothetical protein
MCKLRISAHKSNIEGGRYNKIPRNERFCKKFNNHVVFVARLLSLIQIIFDKFAHCIT